MERYADFCPRNAGPETHIRIVPVIVFTLPSQMPILWGKLRLTEIRGAADILQRRTLAMILLHNLLEPITDNSVRASWLSTLPWRKYYQVLESLRTNPFDLTIRGHVRLQPHLSWSKSLTLDTPTPDRSTFPS
jgi:hypothetical protein